MVVISAGITIAQLIFKKHNANWTIYESEDGERIYTNVTSLMRCLFVGFARQIGAHSFPGIGQFSPRGHIFSCVNGAFSVMFFKNKLLNNILPRHNSMILQ